MSDLHSAIEAFRRTGQGLKQLLDAFAATQARDPAAAATALSELAAQGAAGRFPLQVISEIEARLASVAAAEPPPPDDETVIAPPEYRHARTTPSSGPSPSSGRTDRPGTSTQSDSTPSRGSGTGGSGTGGSGASRSGPSFTTHQDYPPMAGEPAVGTVLRGRFRLDEVLGRGGMGVVFKAWDFRREAVDFADTERNFVAIKLLNDSFKENPNSLKALGREFANTQKLNHPNIIQIYDFDSDDYERYYIAMELLRGEPLDRFIRRLRKTGTGLSFAEALPLIEQMGKALATAHQFDPPIIHSDFKPGNVFLNTNRQIKVFDFGIARATPASLGSAAPVTGTPDDDDGDVLTPTRFDPGSLGALTPPYASLEMLLEQHPDPRDDIYALAIVTYELLTGNRPFGHKTTAVEALERGLIPPRIPALTPQQWQGLLHGLAFRRADRTQSIEQFLDELGARRPRRWYQQRSWQVAMAGVGTLIGIGTLAWFAGVEPWLDERQATAIQGEIAAADPAGLGDLLARTAALPEDSRRPITAELATRFATLAGTEDRAQREHARAVLERLPDAFQTEVFARLGSALLPRLTRDPPERVLAQLPIIEDLPPKERRVLLNDAAGPIRDAFIVQARNAFDPVAGRYDYARARDLLEQANRLYTDSNTIMVEQDDLKRRYKDLLSDLDERIKRARARSESLLPDAGPESLPALLGVLRQIDAGKLSEYDYLVQTYADAAQAADPARALALVETGLTLFPTSNELLNQQARQRERVEAESATQTLATLQQQVRTELQSLDKDQPTEALTARLNDLRAANPRDPLLPQAAVQAEKTLRPALSRLIAARDWAAAEALLPRYEGIADPQLLSAQARALADARSAWQARLSGLDEVFRTRLSAGDLDGAERTLGERALLAPDDADLARGRSELVRAYLTQARNARLNGRLDVARRLLAEGMTRVGEESLRRSLEEEGRTIDEAEQAKSSAERARLEQERLALITATKQEFASLIDRMDTSEAEVSRARGLLDRLAGLAPEDPVLQSGLGELAARFSTAAEREAQAGHWDQALALIQSGRRQLPGVTTLDQDLERLRARAAQAENARQAQTFAAREAALGQLLAAPDFTPAWTKDLGAALAELDHLAAGDPDRLAASEDRINSLYGQRVAALAQDNLFAKAHTLLDQWAKLLPRATAPQERARSALETAERTWEQAKGERKRLADITAARQSLVTQAKADQGDKAQNALTLLQRLAPDDPFVTGEAPRLVAQAYVNMASQSAKNGRPDAAQKQIDKALELDPQAAVAEVRAQIERSRARKDISDQVAGADAEGLKNLAEPLKKLSDEAGGDYAQWQQDWIKTLAARVTAEKNPATAERLRTAALALFPNATIPPVSVPAPDTTGTPVPPDPLDEVRAALTDHRLSAAEQALAQAKAQARTPADLPAIEQALAKSKSDADSNYRRFEQLTRARDPAQAAKARGYLDTACKQWTDNDAWQQACRAPAAPVSQTKEPCNLRYAGKGNISKMARCADVLDAAATRGPELVVIPAGSGSAKPFAITRYEVSAREFAFYCAQTGECARATAGADLPITNIDIAAAERYAAWLSRLTGANYRLPSAAEWAEAASAAGDPRFNGATNCLRLVNGVPATGGQPLAAGAGVTNQWGVVNAVGNVQEWTRDGATIQVHGGHFNNGDRDGRCTVTTVSPHSGAADAFTGFRLVRELRG